MRVPSSNTVLGGSRQERLAIQLAFEILQQCTLVLFRQSRSLGDPLLSLDSLCTPAELRVQAMYGMNAMKLKVLRHQQSYSKHLGNQRRLPGVPNATGMLYRHIGIILESHQDALTVHNKSTMLVIMMHQLSCLQNTYITMFLYYTASH